MKVLLLTTLSLITAFVPVAEGATEADRLRKVIDKKNHEITELRKEIDGLHRQLAEEQPQQKPLANSQAAPVTSPEKPTTLATQEHVVVSGDTLSGIARQYGTSVSQIKKLNGLDSNLIRLGDKLKVASERASQPAAEKSQVSGKSSIAAEPQKVENENVARSYKIKAGDTFHSIARREGVSIAQIRELNPTVQANRLRIGQSIVISEGSSATPAPSTTASQTILFRRETPVTETKQASAPSKPAPKQISEIELNEEMTFESFAKAQGMSMARLNELNGHKLAANEWLAAGSVFYVEQ